MKVTDEMLMALADGELDGATAAGVTRALESDPALRRRLAEFERTRILAKDAFRGVLDEAVPERLLAVVAANENRRPRAGGWRLPSFGTWLPVGVALAATIGAFALGTALAPDLRRGDPSLPPTSQEIAGLLETTPSGEARTWPDGGEADGGGSFEAVASYEVPGGICRSFRLSGGTAEASEWQGIACHHGEAWNVEMLVAGSGLAGDDGLFSTASDRATQSIDTFLDAMGAGASLDAAAERELLENGWQLDGASSE